MGNPNATTSNEAEPSLIDIKILPGVPDMAVCCWGVQESLATTPALSLGGMDGSDLAGLAGSSDLLGLAFAMFKSSRLERPWFLRGLRDAVVLLKPFWGLATGEDSADRPPPARDAAGVTAGTLAF